jgi:hypothetical protein
MDIENEVVAEVTEEETPVAQVEEAVSTTEEESPLDVIKTAMGGEPEPEPVAIEGKAEEPDDFTDDEMAKLSEKTQQRMRKLVEERNTLQSAYKEAEQATQTLQAINSIVGDVPIDMDDFETMVDINRAFVSADEPAMREAIVSLVAAYTKITGKEFSTDGINPFSEHEDLARQIETGELSTETAAQIARARAIEQERYEQQQSQYGYEQQRQYDAQMYHNVEMQSKNAINNYIGSKIEANPALKDGIMATLKTIARDIEAVGFTQAQTLVAEKVEAYVATERQKLSRQPVPMTSRGGSNSLQANNSNPYDAVKAAMYGN